jgi:hypothetical protein
MFNPYAYSFHEYGKVARVYGFLGVSPSLLLTATWPHTQFYYREQDIQLVVSDPKAFNNIIVKDQPIFEVTEAFLRYVFPFE